MDSSSLLRILFKYFLLGMLIQVEAQNMSGGGTGGSCSCGRRNDNAFQTRIVGGVEARPNEFPWRCAMIYDGLGLCGCSLISNKWFMSAAHCRLSGRQVTNIVLGAHSLDGERRFMLVTPSRIITHPRYNDVTNENDISLIELSEPITPSREISPVCLPWNMMHRTFAGSTAVTSGWGLTNGSDLDSETLTLRKVNLPVLSNRQCTRIKDLRSGNPKRITEEMICGLREGRGICFGDSGGSLDLKSNSRYYAIGISSWGLGSCTGFNVFTRVTHFLGWIQDITEEDFCRV